MRRKDDTMKIGDLIKTRHVRSYFVGKEARGWAEFRTDNGTRKRDEKQGFVLLLLGIEKLHCDDGEQLDTKHQLNSLGLWGEDQLTEVLGKEAADKLIQKLIGAAHDAHIKEGGNDEAASQNDQDAKG
jgi:hypothetical protein